LVVGHSIRFELVETGFGENFASWIVESSGRVKGGFRDEPLFANPAAGSPGNTE
jgi:hypothetical protein